MKVLIIGGKSSSLIGFRGPLIRELKIRGHEVLACAGEPEERVINKLLDWGISFKPLNLSRTGLSPYSDSKLVFQLYKIIKNYNPDLVLSYTIKPVIWGGIASKLAKVKSINSLITGLGYAFIESGGLKSRVINKIATFLYKISLGFSNKVFFQNPDDLKEFVDKKIVSSSKCRVINGSGVDLTYYSIEKTEKKLLLGNKKLPVKEPDNIKFLLIARLLYDKGIREYVEAAREVKKSFDNVTFLLVGNLDPNPSSVKEEDLKSWVDEGVIEYLGELKDPREAYLASDVYVLPSYREGTPRTVLEAMAFKMPIITTDAPGCRETIKNPVVEKFDNDILKIGENGILVEGKDSISLASAMRVFLNNKELVRRLGESSFLYVKERYEVSLVNDQLIKELC